MKNAAILVLSLIFSPSIMASPQLTADLSKLETIRFGDTIQKILERHGFSQGDMSCLKHGGHFNKVPELTASEKYLARRVPHSSTLEVKFYEDNGKWAQVYWKNPTDCGAGREPIQWEVEVKKASGPIKGSLYSSLAPVFTDSRMVTRFQDAFRFCCNLKTDLQRGDSFSLSYERLSDHGNFVKYGEILRATLQMSGKTYKRRFVALPGGGTYFAEDLIRSDAEFYLPVSYFHISSLFQPRRFHPVKRRRQAHHGIDFALPIGAPVFASKKGKVSKIGRSRAAGNYIEISHGGGVVSKYMHLSEVEKKLKRGQQVNADTPIGKVGCTGYCTKPHLHFAVKKGRRYIDPLPLLRPYPQIHENEFLSFRE